jgi:hypothetical protein
MIPAGGVGFASLDLREERVVIANYTSSPVDLSDWQVRSAGLDLTDIEQQFCFPDGTVIRPGGRLVLLSGVSFGTDSEEEEEEEEEGQGDDDVNGTVTVAWTRRKVWNDGGDTAELIDRGGRSIDRLSARLTRDGARCVQFRHDDMQLGFALEVLRGVAAEELETLLQRARSATAIKELRSIVKEHDLPVRLCLCLLAVPAGCACWLCLLAVPAGCAFVRLLGGLCLCLCLLAVPMRTG